MSNIKIFISAVLIFGFGLSSVNTVYSADWAIPYYTELKSNGIIDLDVKDLDESVTKNLFCKLIVEMFGEVNFDDFYGEEYITREQAVKTLADIVDCFYFDNTHFLDDTKIDDNALSGVSAFFRCGIINGYEDYTFKPKNLITNAELIKILYDIKELNLHESNLEVFAIIGEAGAENGKFIETSFSGITDIVAGINSEILILDCNNSIYVAKEDHIFNYIEKQETMDFLDVLEDNLDNEDEKESTFFEPYSMDLRNNILYVADRNNSKIYCIEDGQILNLEVKNEEFSFISGLAVDDRNNIYISDAENNQIYLINEKGECSVWAGNGSKAFKDGNKDESAFDSPTGLKYKNGILYVADTGNHAIRMVKDGQVVTISGGNNSKDNDGIKSGEFLDSSTKEALFSSPMKIEVTEDGVIYVSDTGNSLIRKIQDEQVTTVAGIKNMGKHLVKPLGLTLLDNKLYVADNFTNKIYCITLDI